MTEKKAVLITGSAQRVGASLALSFADAGYDILLHFHNSEAAAERIKRDIEAKGVQCTLLAHDLCDVAGIDAFMKEARRLVPHCEVLVNNASVFERGLLMETDEKLFDEQMAINFKAPFFVTQAFVRYFKKGCVINMLDTSVKETQGSHFAYLLSKKALASFTSMAARQLGPDIRCHGICPGILLPSNELDEEYMQRVAPTLPMKKIGTLDQVASTALWLAESQTTGQFIFVDGGQHVL